MTDSPYWVPIFFYPRRAARHKTWKALTAAWSTAVGIVAWVIAGGPTWAAELPPLHWEVAGTIPNPQGLAGMFAGTSREIVIAAGGANFPDAPPWLGGTKVWHDVIYTWREGNAVWHVAKSRLPQPLAYGVSVSHDDSIVCVGGDDGQKASSRAFRLRCVGPIPAGDAPTIDLEPLPDLPIPCTQMCGALVGNILVVAGGQDSVDARESLQTVWSLDLAAAHPAWRRESSWPGPGRIQAVAGSWQSQFFLFGGIELIADPDTGKATRRIPYLSDAYALDLPARVVATEKKASGSPAPWRKLSSLPRPVAAAPSPALLAGQTHLMILGGVDGSLFHVEPGTHPGFPTDLLAYHPLTDRWSHRSHMPPEMARVTAPLIVHGKEHLIISGESRPGIRSPLVQRVKLSGRNSLLQWPDMVILCAYLGSMVWIGSRFHATTRSTREFFLAGGRIPWWAAGVSIFATTLSAITYLSIPAHSFAYNWVRFPQNCGILLIAPFVIAVYLPYFRRLQLASAYEYLEQRFDVSVRIFGSLSFIVFQIVRMGIVLLLPALALSAVTGINLYLCIVMMGLLSTVYTVLGGMEAVVWTDVVQAFVLLGGALIALGVMVSRVDGGLAGLVAVAQAHGKFVWLDAPWDLSRETWPVILLAMFFVNLVPYTTDQSIIQRYLSTSSSGDARRAIWMNGCLAIPASAIFFAVGTALFAFYQQLPERLPPLNQADQIFPTFIARELPAGLSGLVIAGVFAAAMSSLDSSMHSIATALTTDFVQRFGRTRTDGQLLRIARTLTLGLGLIGTVTAAGLAWTQVPLLWTLFLEMLGLLGGTLCGLFMLGIFTRGTRAKHAWCGIIVSIVALGLVKYLTTWSGLLYAPLGSMTCLAAGWMAAVLVKSPADVGG